MVKKLKLSESGYTEVGTEIIEEYRIKTLNLTNAIINIAQELQEAVDNFVPVAIEDAENFDPNYKERRIISNANRIAQLDKYLQRAKDELDKCDPNRILDVDYYKHGGTD